MTEIAKINIYYDESVDEAPSIRAHRNITGGKVKAENWFYQLGTFGRIYGQSGVMISGNTTTMQNADQVLDVDISQLEIRDSARKRSSSSIFEVEKSNDDTGSTPVAENLRRSGRKRIRPLESDKRRVLSKPKKLLDNLNSKEIVNYYLDKKVKRSPPTLETIFEEPSSATVMTTRKFRRTINFPIDISAKNKLKVKKRIMKAKQVPPRPKRKVTMESLLQRLSSIEEHTET